MLIIDRFEDKKAVIEVSGEDSIHTFNIPESILPEGAKVGSVIKISIDNQETKNRKRKIKQLSEELFE